MLEASSATTSRDLRLTFKEVQRTQGRTWWKGLEVPLSKVEVPLSGMEVPLSGLRPQMEVLLRRVDLLRIGDMEEKIEQVEILWRVKRQQQQLLLLLMISHMQFLTMFSSLSQTW